MASPLSTGVLLICWAQETTVDGGHAPQDWITIPAMTFMGHDRDLHGCECADSLRPWPHCPAHRGRARIFAAMGRELGDPYWKVA